MTLLRIALGLAYSRDARQRWRQVSVVGSVVVATLLILLGAGVVGAAAGSDARIRDRSPGWADPPADARFFVSLRGAYIEDENYQFPVVWLEPAPGHERDPDIVPPGLRELPRPGHAVLSPGLAARGLDATDYGLQPSDAGTGPDGTIGLEGLSTSSEGWIYARPPDGRTLGDGGALLPLRGYAGRGGARLETEPQVPSAVTAMVGVLWLLVAPALFVLFSGARAMSQVRLDRARTLLRLGVTPRRVRALLGLETVLLAAPGVGLALGIWVALSSHAQRLPLTGATLHPEALSIPPLQAAALTVAVLAAVGGAATLGRLDAPAHRVRAVRRWHVLPLVGAVSMMVGSRFASPVGATAAYLLFGGLILTFAALPLALPVAVARLGRMLAGSESAPMWLAGRRLSLRAVSLSRPAAVVGLLVFLAGGAFAAYGRMLTVEPEPTSALPLSRFDVNWRDPRPADLVTVRERLPQVRVIPVDDSLDNPVAVFRSCGEARAATAPVDLNACAADGALSRDFVRDFAVFTGLAPVLRPTSDEEGASTKAPDDRVLLTSAHRLTHRDVMQALAGQLPAVNITQIGPPPSPVRTVGWLILGWITASLVLAFALLREVGDRALASLPDDDKLSDLGLLPGEIARTQRWTLLPPILLAVPIGYVGAVAFAVYGYYLGFTVNYLLRITAVALGVAVMAGVSLGVALEFHRRATAGRTVR